MFRVFGGSCTTSGDRRRCGCTACRCDAGGANAGGGGGVSAADRAADVATADADPCDHDDDHDYAEDRRRYVSPEAAHCTAGRHRARLAADGTIVLATPLAEAVPPADAPHDGDWRFGFHGFLRAPLRVGVGHDPALEPGDDADTPAIDPDNNFHAPPRIPDGTFTDWRYTNNLPGPWAELRFEYGNKRVTGNVLIAAYNLTEGGYRNLQSQLGIDQAFVTIDESDLVPSRFGFIWNVGAFQNRYGAAGRYDAGKYETYLIGRTHIAGETLTGFYHLSDDLTVTLEHGIGVKFEPPPFVSGLPEPNPPYLPYAGPVQQGTQLLHHLHAMLSYTNELQIGAHYVTTWTDDAHLAGEVDGRITVLGADVRLIDSRYGDGYIGFSHLESRTPLRLGDGLEVLHSTAGWNLRDNFFGVASNGSGTVNTLLWQYTISLARFMRYPEPFWGQGPDLSLALFGMYNHVINDDSTFVPAANDFHAATNKLKWGGEVTYTFISFLGLSFRYDSVQPDLDNSTVSFHVLSPKLIFRTEFVTHEQVILQYSHYIDGANVTPSWPSEPLTPDKDAFMIAAVMWW